MERQATRKAFSRAFSYLDYHPVAKWLAILAASGSGVLYVALLVVLWLFADLMVSRGKLPSFRDLVPEQQAAVLDRWTNSGPADREAALLTLGVDPKSVPELLTPSVGALPAISEELIWRAHLRDLLTNRVDPEAASAIVKVPLDQDIEDQGILSLIVRNKGRESLSSALGWIAAHNRWMWATRSENHGNSFYYLTGLLTIAVVLALFRAGLTYLMHDMAARASIEAATRMRRAVYHHTFRLGTLAIRALGPSEAVSILTRHIEAIHDALYAWLTVVLREPIKFCLLLAFALVVNFWLALAFLLFATLVWLVGGQLAAHYRRQGRLASNRAAEQLTLIRESLMLMRLVKVYLMELFNQARVERLLTRHANSQYRRYLGEAIYRPILIFVGTLALLILCYVGGLVILQRQLSIASAITLATALVGLYWPVETWLGHRKVLRRGREAAVSLFNFLGRPGEVGQVVGAEFLPGFTKRLEFDNVSLREPGTSRLLLENVSLTIKAGQRVALVGPDDLEKHALVYLIPRFLDPTSGEIRIDQHNLRWITLDSLRAQIALVLQHNLVFHDSVANNIGCGDPAFTLPQIIEAAKVAHAHQFIQKLPKGYETTIGELGQDLSISQQFRIALARAILRKPGIYIIEEPPVALDDETKALLDDTFARELPGQTAIFLPHRLSTIKSCDQVLLLHRGHLEAIGDHRELLTSSPLYRHLTYLEFSELADQV